MVRPAFTMAHLIPWNSPGSCLATSGSSNLDSFLLWQKGRLSSWSLATVSQIAYGKQRADPHKHQTL